MSTLSPYEVAWALGKLERDLELIQRGEERTLEVRFDRRLRLEVKVRLTSGESRVECTKEEG